jgi:Zn-dependent protease with chaperone function
MTMSGFFSELGARAGKSLRQGNWALQSLTGTDAQALAAEEKAGRDLAAELAASRVLSGSEAENHWLTSIAAALASCLKEKRRTFRVGLLLEGEPNAMALPGGFVFVERSLLDLCEWDRDQAAFVLAHEFGHVVRGHALARWLGGPGLARAATALPIGGPAGMALRHIGTTFLTTAYAREQEFEADDFGRRLTRAAGFDGTAGARMLGRLRDRHANELPNRLGDYFASHPPMDERIARLNRPGAGR